MVHVLVVFLIPMLKRFGDGAVYGRGILVGGGSSSGGDESGDVDAPM